MDMLKIRAILSCVVVACGGPAYASPTPGAQDPALVAAQAQEFLRKQAATYPGTPHIEVDASRLASLPPCTQMQFFLSGDKRLRSTVSIGVRCAAPRAWTSYLQATVSIQGSYYVPVRTLKPGETLDLGDLDRRTADLLSLPPDTIVDPGQLLGRITTHRLNAGAPIKSSALRNPQSILRGQTVRLEARGKGFVASGEGKAMQSGAPGAQIQVRTSTGRIVTGTVVDATTISVII